MYKWVLFFKKTASMHSRLEDVAAHHRAWVVLTTSRVPTGTHQSLDTLLGWLRTEAEHSCAPAAFLGPSLCCAAAKGPVFIHSKAIHAQQH